jgi:hypothetical protein
MSSRRATVLLLCCTGCWSETHGPGCSEPVYTEIADDEATAWGTPDNLVAIAARGWTGVADHFGSEVDASFTVERGEGPALFADTEEIDVVTRQWDPGGGDSYLLVAVTCNDWVEVPADFTIVSEEAEIDLAMDATIRSPNEFSDSGADIEASVPYEQSGLVVESIDDETYEQESVEVSISMLPAEQSRGTVDWIGTDPDYGRMVPILEWGLD